MIFFLPALIACGSGVTDPGAEVYDALAFSDQELPEAWVGINYRHMLSAEGGVPPVTWNIDRGRLPDGLRLKYDGRITGTPTEPGVYEILVAATDGDNNRKFAEVSLPVRFEPVTVGCGDVLESSFNGSNGGVDWSRFDTYRWLQIQLPEPDVTRIEAVMRGDGAALGYIPEAGEPPGSHNLADGYVQTILDGETTSVTVDLATEPSLTSFRTDGLPIPLLLVGNGVRDWSMEIVCTKAPIFERLWTLPVEQGEPIAIDYDILGDQSTVRIWTDDVLPEWVTLNESGILEGTAEEPGGWDFTIKAEDDEGRIRGRRDHVWCLRRDRHPMQRTPTFADRAGMVRGGPSPDPTTLEATRYTVCPSIHKSATFKSSSQATPTATSGWFHRTPITASTAVLNMTMEARPRSASTRPATRAGPTIGQMERPSSSQRDSTMAKGSMPTVS